MVKVTVENAECQQALPLGLIMLKKQTALRLDLDVPTIQRTGQQGDFSLAVTSSEHGDHIEIKGGAVKIRGFFLHQQPQGFWESDPWVLRRTLLVDRQPEGWKFDAKPPTNLTAGNVDWQGYAGTLTWDGPPSRYWHVETSMAHVANRGINYPTDVPPSGTKYTTNANEILSQAGQSVYQAGKKIAQFSEGAITSATLSSNGKRCMVTLLVGAWIQAANIGYSVAESLRICPERVYFFNLTGGVVQQADMRLSAEITQYECHADFLGGYTDTWDDGRVYLTPEEEKAAMTRELTRVWRFNASGTIGVTERMGTRQTMTVDWAEEAVEVVAGIAAHTVVSETGQVATITWTVEPNPDADGGPFPGWYQFVSATTLNRRDIVLKICDWIGDTLIEGEVSTLKSESSTLDPDTTTRTEVTTITIDGVTHVNETIVSTIKRVGGTVYIDATRTGGYTKIYLQGLDLRSRSLSVDMIYRDPIGYSDPVGSSSGSSSVAGVLENRTTIAGTAAAVTEPFTALDRVELDTLGVYIQNYIWSGYYGPVGTVLISGGKQTRVGKLTDGSWWAAQEMMLAPHNGRGIRDGAIATRLEYKNKIDPPTVQVLAEIPRFPIATMLVVTDVVYAAPENGYVGSPPTWVDTFTYADGEMMRFAHNVPKEDIPEVLIDSVLYPETQVPKEIIRETKNWGAIYIV